MTEQRRIIRIEYRRMPDRKILDADPRRDLVMHDPIGHASKHRQKYNGNPLHTDLAARSDTAIVKQPPSHHFDVHFQPAPYVTAATRLRLTPSDPKEADST